MKFKKADDVFKEKEEREREQIKEETANDLNDVLERFKTLRKEKKSKKKPSMLWILIKTIWFIGCLMFVSNFVLANIWLLRFFFKEFF